MNESLQPTEELTDLPLSEDEHKVLFEGVPYDELPESFTISETVLESCLDVWNTFSTSDFSPMYYSARERARAFYLKRLGEGGEEQDNARQHLAHLDREEKYETEYGLQMYLVDNKIIKGRVHRGKRKSILLRNKLDQIPDEQSVVNIHNHPNDLTFSLQDIITVIADVENVPHRCLYLVVTSAHLYLIFPTINTVRVDLEVLRKQLEEANEDMWEVAGLEGEARAEAQLKYVSAACKKSYLGFYYSQKDKVLRRS